MSEKDALREINEQITRIRFILESDNTTHQKGLVEKVSNIESKLTDLLTRELIYKAKATTWGVIGGAVGGALMLFAKTLLAKIL